MISKKEKNSWLSAHIYFDGNIYSDFCDEVIKQILLPFFVKKENTDLFEKYFFIRYSDVGPHIRIRFFGNVVLLEEKLKPLFELSVCQHISKFVSTYKIIESGISINEDKFFIKWITYEPEIERYGGDEAIKVAEEYFYYSSNTAAEIIKIIGKNDKSSRLGKGLALMVILLQKFCVDKEIASKLISSYSSAYLKAIAKEEKYHETWVESFDAGFNSQSDKLVELVNTIWDLLDKREELPEILDNYSKNLEIIANRLQHLYVNNKITMRETLINDWDTCVFSIIPSYIHMMNNRLGIPIQEESYLAHLIYKGILAEYSAKKEFNE